jgi:UDP-N-acetyl-D-glucosamine dehydrogenase
VCRAAQLRKKLASHEAQAGVVGMGYVGLPLAVELAQAGFSVTGIDIDACKVARTNCGESFVQDIPTSVLKPLVAAGKLRATTDFSAVAQLETINIAVPTPLRKTEHPPASSWGV